MATQQLLEKFEAICSPDSVFCLYTGLIERLVATNQALTVSDIWGGLDLRALDLELAIVDILRLLQSTRRCWRDSTEKLGQSTALRALREFMEVPQRAKFVLGLHDRVDALVSSCGEAFDSVGDLEGIKKGVDLWSRDCKRQLHYFTTAVAIGDEKGVFASQLKEAAGLGLVSELQELWELASFWMKQPARLTAGEQQLLNRVAQVMAKKELFKDYEGVDTLPAGLVRGDLLALVKKSSLPDWLFEEQDQLHQIQHLRVDGLPNQPVQLRLYLGVQPGNKNCPRGMYRPSGAGIAVGECEFCPRGVYGDSPGLESKDCTAKCPKGTFNDKLGAKSILDCKPCPAGVYGSSTGLTTSQCSGPCPNGKYSMSEGVQPISDCMDCPPLYRGPQGYRGNDVTMENGGGYPCDRYQYGKTILNGRDANNDAWLYGYLSEARQPTNNQVNDKITPW
ncbi:hypothetical protein JG687_00011648 [Phytophthora cactorum]|uniref:Tyrosine-protein kinase ephrin type A/B receptor-like domain-containing protein n=1 Tax=Phytophthora cactorum TaxID=29920 RepID=A0A8T1U7S7_9STRA|nr:hypothetical protein JG687_00011648 [Phytophthora cactorum]